MILELRRSNPAQLVALKGRGRATHQIAEVEVEADAAVGIDVRERAPERAHRDLDADLLQHLPLQAVLDGLSFVPLSPRKFPATALVIALLPAGDQHLRSVPENTGGDFVEAHGRARVREWRTGSTIPDAAAARQTSYRVRGMDPFFSS